MTRTILTAIGLIAILGGGLYLYQHFYGATTAPLLAVTPSAPRADLPGAQIIAELGRLPKDLDGRIFSSPAYKELVDGTVLLQDIPVGKVNPFAPIFAPTKSTKKR